ncbi:MAG: hypothetical protein ACR2O0_03350, partial [Rhizobiaceae bacterium]
MIEAILSLPEWAGIIAAMAIATLCGLAVYFASHLLIRDNRKEELKDPMSNMFRVIGTLVGLMLSLAFAEVVYQTTGISNALEREAIAIADTYRGLKQFDEEGTRQTRTILIEYTKAVVEDDWPALADDRLGKQSKAIHDRLAVEIATLEADTEQQKRLLSRIDADLDIISDSRLIRIDNALAEPPLYNYVIMFGFLITMACFGAYTPHVPIVVLLSLYTSLIGLVLYLIVSY